MDQDQDHRTAGLDYEPSYLSSYTFRDQYAPLSVGQWLFVFAAVLLPGINLLMLLFWAFAGNLNKNLQNFSRGLLLFGLGLLLLAAGALAVLRITGIPFSL